ncbi:hypothetical protein AMR41_03645 [Hapalosiphon sp. MRB220]|nr:hypothetical protein AMR41_03645 [Hapalosiphon sp. MRB220]
MNITDTNARSASVVKNKEIKIFRQGNWYKSLDSVLVPYTRHYLHLASSLMVLDDAKKAIYQGRLATKSVLERAALLEKAMTLFTSGNVFVEGFGEQSPEDFAQLLWQALGLPGNLVAQWSCLLAEQLTLGLAQLENVEEKAGNCLVSLPANTFVCLDACFLPLLSGMKLWIRPSQREPFSAWRFLSCLLEVGWPCESLGFYPMSHATLASIAPRMQQSIIYGGDDVQRLFANQSNITVHGPGRAFAIAHTVTDTVIDQLLTKIVGNAGRFCLCLGTILCENSALVLGETLASLLDQVPLDPQADSNWPLAVRPDVEACERQINRLRGLVRSDDRILTQRPWLVHVGDRCIPVPTMVYLNRTKDHPLLGVEVDFPFAVIGDIDQEAVNQLSLQSRFFYQLGN